MTSFAHSIDPEAIRLAKSVDDGLKRIKMVLAAVV